MWKQLWRIWTIDKPAAFGDWLWQVLVVELAAWLDRLTLRQIIAFIPVVILVVAYLHRIPLPPELLLVGDLLAYLDIFSMIALLGLIGRAGTVFGLARLAVRRVLRLVSHLNTTSRGLDHRHRRASATRRRRLTGSSHQDSDADLAIAAIAWA